MANRITHKDVEAACKRYNDALQLTYPCAGYLRWADIRGDGTNRRGLYMTIGTGGVHNCYWRGKTMRETIANIDLAVRFYSAPAFQVIINAIHEHGTRQVIALDMLSRRGLWLSPEQRQQAGLA